MMDILELIAADHRTVDTLFAEIESAEDIETLYEICNQLYEELSFHTEAEDAVFYPALQAFEAVDALLREAEDEHVEIKDLLEEIKTLSPSSPQFRAKITDLKAAVQHHVEEEESQLFTIARELMSQEDLEVLSDEFEGVKNEVKEAILVALVR